MDPGCTPQRVFLAHSSDEIAQLTIDLRPPCPISRLPTPEHLEARAMPPQDGLGLNNLRRAKKVWPESGHPYEQRAITAKKSKAGWYSPQNDVELMTQKQILGFKPAPRLKQVDDE
jgi:hypothetical protein